MPKIASSRIKTVVAPKKPTPKAKAKTERKEKVAPRDAFSTKGAGGKKNVVATELPEARSAREMREFRAALDKAQGRGSDPVRERQELRERLDAMAGRKTDPAKKVLVGGTGSEASTREQKELRERLNRVFVGGQGSDRSPISFTDYNGAGGRNS